MQALGRSQGGPSCLRGERRGAVAVRGERQRVLWLVPHGRKLGVRGLRCGGEVWRLCLDVFRVHCTECSC